MRQVSRNAEMPFLDHLEELRWRIIYSLAAILLAPLLLLRRNAVNARATIP